METVMTTSKTLAAALAALTIATTIVAAGGEAQARFGFNLLGAAGAYADPAYAVNAGYDECRFVDRTDRLGNVSTLKICDVVPY
jgi:hypothetical protein